MKSFNDINEKIRIPKIQRDYAQGRENPEANEIRKQFVHDLMRVVNGKSNGEKLDFIYGSDKNGAFEPLDGQQRLTTLFLLHYLLGVDLRQGDKSKLTYETRYTSEAFLDELIKHDVKQFTEELKNNEEKNEEKKGISSIIKERDWFQWEWQYDPTISSMLVMLDALNDEMNWEQDLEIAKERLNSLKFHFLDLGKLNMSDELFIKMNARGKQLSNFDKLKSTLEEELQKQKNCNIEKDWRTNMDGNWIDFFWQKFALKKVEDADLDANKQLEAAKVAETNMKTFIQRLIAMQFYVNEKVAKDLHSAAYNIDVNSLDSILTEYEDMWMNGLNGVKREETLNFSELTDTINAFIYQDEKGNFEDVTTLIDASANFYEKKQDETQLTYFENFLRKNIPNDLRVVLYGISKYIFMFREKSPNKTTICGKPSNEWIDNFAEWSRFIRNLFNNDNNNNRIDKEEDTRAASEQVNKLLANLEKYLAPKSTDLNNDNLAIKKFIADITIDEYKGQGLDNNSLREEKQKAVKKLRSKDWERAINEAEAIPYMWGQIRCLLNWAGDDLNKFKAYTESLSQILIDSSNNHRDYYLAMLLLNDNAWRGNDRLYVFGSMHRDYSIKRYLRNEENGIFGKNIKEMIDIWHKWNVNMDVSQFFEYIIKTKNPTNWVYSLKIRPQILDMSRYKCIFEKDNHILFAERMTQGSTSFDPALCALNEIMKEKLGENGASLLNKSNSDDPHTVYIDTAKESWRVSWGNNLDEYVLERKSDGTKTKINGVKNLLGLSLV